MNRFPCLSEPEYGRIIMRINNLKSCSGLGGWRGYGGIFLGLSVSLALAGVVRGQTPPISAADVPTVIEKPEDHCRRPGVKCLLVPEIGEEVKPLIVEAPPVGEESGLPAFVLDGVALSGNVAIKTGELQKVFEDKVCPIAKADRQQPGIKKCETITVGDLFAIRDGIQKLYRDRGYFLTRVVLEPGELPLEGATPKIRVVEGVITSVVLNGEPGPVDQRILRIAGRLKTRAAVTMAEVERQLLLIQDLPGIAVRARFSPSPTGAGAVLTLDVVRTPYAGYMALDNRGPGYAGPWQATLAVAAHSHTALGERVELYLYSTPSKEQRFGQVALTVPLNEDGLTLRGHAGYGPSYPGGLLREAGFASNVTTGGLSLSYPVIRSRRTNLWVQAGTELNNANIRLKQADGRYERLSESHLRIASLEGRFSHADAWLGVTELTLAVNKGLKGLGATPSDSDLSPRPDSRSDFTRADIGLSRRQALTSSDGMSLDLVTAIVGTYGFDVLPPSQKAQLGGAGFGRGYHFGQLTGDRSVQTSIELAGRAPAGWLMRGATVGPYVFYDYGTVWDIAPGDPPRRYLHSVGTGVRLGLGHYLSLDLEYARRLITNPGRNNDDRLKPDQMFVRLVGRF